MPGDVIQGPWPQLPANTRKQWPPPGWKLGGLAGLSDTEARRAAILAAKVCRRCEVPFKGTPPDDRLCVSCRRAETGRTEPPAPDDPALF